MVKAAHKVIKGHINCKGCLATKYQTNNIVKLVGYSTDI